MRPRLGILDFNPIQYHTPLYRRIAERGNLRLDVLYLSDRGHSVAIDSGFGVPIAWDIDLLSDYECSFLGGAAEGKNLLQRVLFLIRWVRSHEAIVLYGYANPWMLLTAAICYFRRVPYLLRGDSQPASRSKGFRRTARHIIARTVVSRSAGGLAIGELNAEFYRTYKAPRVLFAPYSVDDERFSRAPQLNRSELLTRLKLHDSKPIIMFCGKLTPRKRPLDLTAAVDLLPNDVTTLFVGDGALAECVRAALRSTSGMVTGFINQSELPSYYHAADILVLPSEDEPWGLVVNEAMAAGALPVVSDRVGAAPDLVFGVGEVYSCGDIEALSVALSRALVRVKDPGVRDQVRRHAARYSLEYTCLGFEKATMTVCTDCATLSASDPKSSSCGA